MTVLRTIDWSNEDVASRGLRAGQSGCRVQVQSPRYSGLSGLSAKVPPVRTGIAAPLSHTPVYSRSVLYSTLQARVGRD